MFAASKTDSASTGGYQISRSLRFNSADSAYLNRTPASAGNRRTWTWSAWIKRSALDVTQQVFSSRPTASPYALIYFQSTGKFIYSETGLDVQTTQVFRDASAWYHIVITTDTTQATASDRLKFYVNGVQVTSFSTATYPSQNYDTQINTATQHNLSGAQPYGAEYFSGYMTEVNFIDGQALTPSSFGETNAQTGVWQPKAYSGSYGTNGFYLNFSDNSNTTAATLGKDYSGNGNNWTPNNFSVTAGAGNDSLVDSPTSYGTDTGVGGTVRGNYATINPLAKLNWQSQGGTLTPYNGNLQFDGSSAGAMMDSTIAVRSGKWYWEITQVNNMLNGIRATRGIPTGDMTYRYYQSSGEIVYTPYNSATTQVLTFAATASSGDIIGIALDLDNSTISWYKNNTLLYTATSIVADEYTPCVGNAAAMTGAFINFGQRPFAYTAPSGFKALCTQNLPTPTIGATTATQAGKYFNAVLYTGNNSTQSVTGVGFQPDLVWAKSRSNAYWHTLVDSVRGRAYILASNTTNADIGPEPSDKELTAFTSDGFNLGPDYNLSINSSGATFVAWNWKANGAGSSNTAGSITSTVSANTTSGFSVVTYTGTGANASVGHGLGVKPAFIIVKKRSTTGGWVCWQQALTGGSEQDRYIYLDLTSASGVTTNYWGTSGITSTTFGVWASGGDNNASGATFVAYCFAEVAGYSKFGSFVGNGSADGAFVFTGMRPAFVMLKASSAGGAGYNWGMFDNDRLGYNSAQRDLRANTTDTEGTDNNLIDFLSNGFKIRSTSGGFGGGSGVTYIYMAFAENPFKYSLAR